MLHAEEVLRVLFSEHLFSLFIFPFLSCQCERMLGRLLADESGSTLPPNTFLAFGCWKLDQPGNLTLLSSEKGTNNHTHDQIHTHTHKHTSLTYLKHIHMYPKHTYTHHAYINNTYTHTLLPQTPYTPHIHPHIHTTYTHTTHTQTHSAYRILHTYHAHTYNTYTHIKHTHYSEHWEGFLEAL